jgi:hypothetical protein
MTQTRRNRIHSIDAKLYLYGSLPSLQSELEAILDEEVADFAIMPEGLRDSGRGVESREAQIYLQKAIKGLGNGKKKTLDEVHECLRLV